MTRLCTGSPRCSGVCADDRAPHVPGHLAHGRAGGGLVDEVLVCGACGDEGLEAARSNLCLQDRRVADLEAKLVDPTAIT
ncbi:hypothetical protein [Streptomyces sp. 4N124]|uniref:hypothetical protein n=1 Tax=Streptomyces sp. 4N124 TaxID=3457420 RepID=UPI003FD51228